MMKQKQASIKYIIFYRLKLYIGCLNTPKYRSRICEQHENTSLRFVDESTVDIINDKQTAIRDNERCYSIVNILERKETRSTEFSKVCK